jgi:hypothetical protein
MADLLDIVESSLVPQSIGIEQFAEESAFCDKFLYPAQTTLLKLIFLEEMTGAEEDILQSWIDSPGEVVMSPDIRERRDYLRERGYSHFREAQLVGGRRSSKGLLTGVAMAKVMWDCLQLGNPHEYYGIAHTREIYFSCVAASEAQAKEFQYSDLAGAVETCKAFEPYLVKSLETEFRVATPTDLRKISAHKAKGNKILRDIAKLRGKALAANAGTLRGSATMAIAQPMFSKVWTPMGWTTIGELQVGDTITGSNGGSQKVLKLHPRGEQRAYQVTFSDGSSTICGDDHLWTLQQGDHTHTKPISEFAQDIMKRNGTQGEHAKWRLPEQPILEGWYTLPLPLHPYLLGVMLGDGSMTGRVAKFYNEDPSIIEAVRQVLPTDHVITYRGNIGYDLCTTGRQNLVIRSLKAVGAWGHLGPVKFIPEKCLMMSPEDRLHLLQGLLDTDGTVNGTSVRFGSSSCDLAKGVVDLVRSLGGYATLGIENRESIGISGVAQGEFFVVCISGLDSTTLFRSAHKLGRAAKYTRYARRHRRLISVEEVESCEMQCITVANPDGLYLTDDFIVTHNCMDEMAWMIPGESNASAEQVYTAAEPSLAQFGIDAIMFLNSSPATKVGKFYEVFEIGMRPLEVKLGEEPGDSRMFTFEFPSWKLFEGYMKYKSRYKQRTRGREFGKMITVSPDWDPEALDVEGDALYSEQDKQNIVGERLSEAKNPESYKVERRGKFAEVIDSYLNPSLVDQMYAGCPIGMDPQVDGSYKRLYTPLYTNFGQGANNLHKYKFHLDPSSTTAGFGFAIAHIEYFPNLNSGEEEEHVVFDMIKRWDPKGFGGTVIRWEPILREVITLADMFRPFEITMDQHQSAQPIQDLQERLNKRNISCQVYERVATNELNWKRWEVLKTSIYQGLVHAPCDEATWNDPTCQNELKFLQQMPTGGKFPKIDKQDIGPVRTKDQADCVAECVNSLIGNLMLNRMRDRMATGGSFGGKGGYGIGFGGEGGPIGGPGPPGISGYYSSRQAKVGKMGEDRASLTRSALGSRRSNSRGNRSRGRF